MKKSSQYYSEIAREYLRGKSIAEMNDPNFYTMITWGDLQTMEDLAELFDAPKEKFEVTRKKNGYGIGYIHRRSFQYVMDKLDNESKLTNAIFRKSYINYPGIINRPTRRFVLKDDII